jgi:hypothetical protein
MSDGVERGGRSFSRGHIYQLLANPIYTGRIAHKGRFHPGQHPALVDDASWSIVRDQLATNSRDHRRRAKAAEPSLLVGLLVDARGERLTPSHAVKKGQRYRYYVSAALITDAGTDRAKGWRLAASEIEEAVIRILADALTSPARLVERFGAASMPGDQLRKLLSCASRIAKALGGSPVERAKLVRELIEKIIVDEKTITIKLRRALLLGADIPSSASEAASDDAVELTAAAAFTRCGGETKLVLPGLAQQTHNSRCDPALIKAIARGRAWFEELATGRARSLQELAKRDGISRRYIRRLVGLAFLSPELVETILQGRQPVELTATHRTRSAAGLDAAARAARKLTATPDRCAPGRAAARPRVIANGQNFRRWDCINAPQREKATEPRFAACTSPLTSPVTRRMSPKCGAFQDSLGVRR